MKKGRYQRLTLVEREEISRGLAIGKTIRAIAQELGRYPSTISREVRNEITPRNYRAITAHRRSLRTQRQHHRGYKIDQHKQVRIYVLEKLRLYWSPIQIAQGLKREYPTDMSMQVSHETIYSYLYVLSRGELKKELLSYLRQKHQRRMKKKNKNEVKTPKIKEMISIEERPEEVKDRIIPGHWEGDILLGKERKSQLGTLVERTTRLVLLVPLTTKKAPAVRQAFVRVVKQIPKHLRLSMTYDQGYEMVEHALFSKDTKMQVYFAHPASPWERGTNENTNGLIRQFFPKGTDFSKVTKKELKRVQNLLNGRPRKVLEWQNPSEVFSNLLR